MIYIEINEKNEVTYTHYMPFDETYGLGKTEEELRQTGVLLEEITKPEQKEGYIAMPYYTAEKGFYYEYEETPKSEKYHIAQEVYNQIIDDYTLELITEGGEMNEV